MPKSEIFRQAIKQSLFRSSILVVIFLFLVGTGFSQYRFDRWTIENGLPQNSVYAIIQTKDGYLWLATLDGLVRFDGVRFTIFNKANSPGINSNRFTALFEDGHGTIWAATDNSGVTRLNRGVFKTFTTSDGLPFNNIRGITGDEQGNLWVLSGEQIMRFENERFIPAGLTDADVRFNNSEWNKDVFFGTKGDLLYRFERGVLTSQKHDKAFLESLNFHVEEDFSNVLWTQTKDRSVFKIVNGKISGVYQQLAPAAGISSANLLPFYGTGFDFTTRTGERFDIKFDRLFRRSLMLPSSNALKTVAFRTIFEDQDNNIWLGTDSEGLLCIRKQFIKVYSVADGLIEKNVYPILEDRSGAVWIGAWLGGISRFKDGKFTNFNAGQGLASSFPYAIYEDRNDKLWMASNNDGDGGIRVFTNGRFERPVPYPDLPNRTVVHVIHQSADGAFWFGTSVGLARFQNGETTFFKNQKGLDGSIRAIIEPPEGGLWIATYAGLTRFQNGTFTTLTETDGLPSDNVRALYEDADGVLWIGTYDGGLGRLKDGKLTKFTVENGLYENGVFYILEDADGYLWMSSNRGIHRTRKQDLNDFAEGRIRNFNSTGYGTSDGMLNIECNGGMQPTGAKTRDGRLWFATQDGAAVVDPKLVASDPQPPPVLIETVNLDGVERSSLHETLSKIEIAPYQRNLEIAYTGLSFNKPGQLRFRYRLEGLDTDWTDAGGRRTAFYPYLPPGKYTFRVIAVNSDNVWNAEGARLEIVVHPAFYQTWWFWTMCAALVGLTTFLFYRRRLNDIRRRQLAQEEFSRRLIDAHEIERRRIAAELHDSIGQSLAMIKNTAVFSSQTAADLTEAREQLTEIVVQSGQAISEVREIAYNLRPYLLDRLGLTKAIVALLEKIEENSVIEVISEIEDIDGLFEKEAEISLYRIIQESLNNILKHAEATEMRVFVCRHEYLVTVEINDNGQGFDVKAKNETGRRGGFGLLGMSERVRMLGGAIMFDSIVGEGTTIKVELKIK